MPAFQSVPDFDLSAKYHLKAVGCEQQAEHATDQTTEQEWRQLAAQCLHTTKTAGLSHAREHGELYYGVA